MTNIQVKTETAFRFQEKKVNFFTIKSFFFCGPRVSTFQKKKNCNIDFKNEIVKRKIL